MHSRLGRALRFDLIPKTFRAAGSADGAQITRRAQKGPLIVTIAVHTGIIALLLTSTVTRPIQPDTPTLSVFNISAVAATATSKAVQPPKRTPIPPPVVLLPKPSATVVALSAAQADVSAVSGACDLTEPVRAALQGSEEVVASLYDIPRERLSVANAIMIWQADWLADESELDTTAVATIRDVISETISAATPECRLQPQMGPRLLLLSGSSDTVVLAVGSGQWRWQDLLDTARAQAARQDALRGNPLPTILASVDRASMAHQ